MDIPGEAFTKIRQFDERACGVAAQGTPTLAHGVELIKVHLHHAVGFRDAAMAELFNKMAREDQKHFATLDADYEKFLAGVVPV